ncbi:Echinoderm microtubule-associated protein-like 6 [Oopsacas minuta]|uniref:Echinoderm microtubule-associated protein-like 6 n=1 Tax=Oopsacas minuta TaxID=111878 RepID=A0AAV7K7G4_9METZ|nr:Echinoderm microtubule-associated protein-like 6 [Oopsacas minuta]
MATGDDLGYVRIYKYPSYVNKAKHKSYVGHSAHVTCVRFSNNGSYLVSLGGNDTSILIWKVINSVGSTDRKLMNNEMNLSSEDDGGYDSYIDWELKIDYQQKTYVNPVRDISDRTDIPQYKGKMDSSKRDCDSKSTKVLTRDGTTDFNSLKLDYVFGYRGFDCRSNLKFLNESHIVYNAAAVGVVMDIVNNTQWFYDQHNDDILSLSVFPNNDLDECIIATGQIGLL